MSGIKNSNTNNNSRKNNKPFCKVCFDAGKLENEYRSHFVKSETGGQGTIVCPTIKSIECRYCHGFGHTVKYCGVLKEKSTQVKKVKKDMNLVYESKNSRPIVAATKSVPVGKTGYFMALDESDDEEDVDTCNNKALDEYPQISNKTAPSATLTGWAAMVSKAVPIPSPRPVVELTSSNTTMTEPCQSFVETAVAVMPKQEYVPPKKKPIMNWADYESDSDDDHEYTTSW